VESDVLRLHVASGDNVTAKLRVMGGIAGKGGKESMLLQCDSSLVLKHPPTQCAELAAESAVTGVTGSDGADAVVQCQDVQKQDKALLMTDGLVYTPAVSNGFIANGNVHGNGDIASLDADVELRLPSHDAYFEADVRPTDSRSVSCSPSEQSKEEEFCKHQAFCLASLEVEFEPGRLGIKVDFSNGRVETVDGGSQADCKGVLVGMHFFSVQGESYTEERLKAALAGIDNYRVIFAKEDVALSGTPRAPSEASSVGIGSVCSATVRKDSDSQVSIKSASRHRDLDQSESGEKPEDELTWLRKKLAETEARAAHAEHRLRMWESLASQASYIVALGPDRGDSYKRTFMKEFTDAIKSVSAVHEVTDLVCSIPAVPSEAPALSLVHWSGNLADPMQWDVQWSSACWHVGVSVLGRQYGVSFSLKLRVHHFGVRGRLQVVLPKGGSLDLSQARVSFAKRPEVDFSVDSEVALGFVPLPVQNQVESKIRVACTQWLRKELVEPNGMLFKIPALKPKYELSDKDVQQAILDAEEMVRRRNLSSWSLV